MSRPSDGGLLSALIDLSLRNRFVILLLASLLILLGVQAASRLTLDAFPDTTPVQIQVNTVAPELGAEEVERLITFPVEYAMGGLKGLTEVRSISKFGLSQVVLIFSDETNIYFARQQVSERLQEVELPAGIARPIMGPVATGVGEIFHFLVTSTDPEIGLEELRTLTDWVIRPRLRRVAGVAEVNPWGGLARQYQVQVNPVFLAKYGLTLDDLVRALKDNNANVGGGTISRGGEAWLVLGVGRKQTVEEIARIVVSTQYGIPIRVGDLARVEIGHAIRRGAATANGQGECVLGLAFLRMGENPREVTEALDQATDELRKSLPPGVRIEVGYRRTDLIDQVLRTVERNLLEGALLVVAILFLFLGNLRAGLIVASAIPLSMLFAVTMMERVGIAGSLMSLGAIDFGLVVDSSVVMIENCVRRLSLDKTDRPRLEVVRDAAVEVRRPTMFGELIIMIVYIPILTLQGVEGKLFRPMALTVVFALAGSLVLSLTLMPVLASVGLSRSVRDRETIVDRLAQTLLRPILGLGFRFPRTTLVAVGLLTGLTTWMGFHLGSEFIPRLNEGGIVISTVRLPSISLEESVEYGSHIERMLLDEFPDEIQTIWTRTGTPEVATDPMGYELSDVFIMLTPRDRWKKARSQEELVVQMARLTDELPGMEAVYTQPIEQRINEMIAGIRSDLGIKIYGPDLDLLRTKAEEVASVVQRIRGAADVTVEQITGQPVVRVVVDEQALSRYGVSARQVLDMVAAAGGLHVGEIIEPDRRFPLVVRLPDRYRDAPEALGQILLTTDRGERLPMTRLARIETVSGPATIPREWGERRIVVQANVRGRDIGSFVEEARREIEREVELPAPYHVAWGGQFENMIRAEQRLLLVVPLALLLIISLLYMTFKSWRDAFLVFSGVLFARVGGILGLWIRGMPFTISAGVGFVALAGASMLQGLVLVSSIRDRMAQGIPKRQAIEQARQARLRPVLMTGTVAALGFLPMMLSTGIGAEVQRPLATVVFFGMIADTFLTLLVLPVLYLLFGQGPARPTGAERPTEPMIKSRPLAVR
ncbi:MAG: cation transporter [Isosphaeraceae bacterium]|jgi:cobalt-zinc-cadmium resistance protein CzcA|nr:MAG: cation transporter [Isosphaeraceae bacterium]